MTDMKWFKCSHFEDGKDELVAEFRDIDLISDVVHQLVGYALLDGDLCAFDRLIAEFDSLRVPGVREVVNQVTGHDEVSVSNVLYLNAMLVAYREYLSAFSSSVDAEKLLQLCGVAAVEPYTIEVVVAVQILVERCLTFFKGGGHVVGDAVVTSDGFYLIELFNEDLPDTCIAKLYDAYAANASKVSEIGIFNPCVNTLWALPVYSPS